MGWILPLLAEQDAVPRDGGWSLRVLSDWGGLWLVGLLAAAVAFYVWQYLRESARLTGGRRAVLTVLRLAVVCVVVLMLLRPAVNLLQVEQRAPAVAVLVDESLSMRYPAGAGDPLVPSAGPWPERSRLAAAREAVARLIERDGLAAKHRVLVYRFSGTLEQIAEIAPAADGPPREVVEKIRRALAEPTGIHSVPGEALLDVARRLSAGKLSGMILISDGRATEDAASGVLTTDEAARRLAAAGIPVSTITTGADEPPRDLALAELAAPDEANLDDLVTFQVRVINHVAPGLQVELTLDEDGRPKVVRRASLRSGVNDVTLSTVAEGPRTGERRYTIRAPLLADEWDTTNNQISATVNVVKRTLRCLLVAGEPTVEYHYLWPALVRDPIIQVSCWLQDADVNYAQQGNAVIDRLPETVEQWDRYDVVLLYDIDPERFTNQQEAGLEQLVRKGGGLMVIAGRTHGLDSLLTVRTAKMGAMLPVEIDRNRHPDYSRVLDEPFEVVRTDAGRAHPILLLNPDPAANDAIWQSFPKLYWAHPNMGVKPRAISLLERGVTRPSGMAPEKGSDTVFPERETVSDPAMPEALATSLNGKADPGEEGRTLLALWRYGEGAVLYSGVHSFWRWRYPYENYDHDRFFSQVVRYLGETRLLGAQKQVTLATDRKLYSPGADVRVTLRVLDPSLLAQLRGEPLMAEVADERGAKLPVPLQPAAAGADSFVGRHQPRRVGHYSVHADHVLAEASSDQKKLFDETTHFDVRLQSLEDVDTAADPAAMAALARATGGRAYDRSNVDRLAELPPSISAEPQRIGHRVEAEVWDTAWFWLGLMALASTEWVLRKKWSLL